MDAFLNTEFEGERHISRLNKIEKETQYNNKDLDLENAVFNELNRQKILN